MNQPKPSTDIQKCIKCELIFPEAWGLEKHTCKKSPSELKEECKCTSPFDINYQCPKHGILSPKSVPVPEKMVYGEASIREIRDKINSIITYLESWRKG